jgi:hypothetical protein
MLQEVERARQEARQEEARRAAERKQLWQDMFLLANPRAKALAVLGLPLDATDEEVTAAYRRLVLEHHPDRGGDAARCIEINEARQHVGQHEAADYAEITAAYNRLMQDLQDPLDRAEGK